VGLEGGKGIMQAESLLGQHLRSFLKKTQPRGPTHHGDRLDGARGHGRALSQVDGPVVPTGWVALDRVGLLLPAVPRVLRPSQATAVLRDGLTARVDGFRVLLLEVHAQDDGDRESLDHQDLGGHRGALHKDRKPPLGLDPQELSGLVTHMGRPRGPPSLLLSARREDVLPNDTWSRLGVQHAWGQVQRMVRRQTQGRRDHEVPFKQNEQGPLERTGTSETTPSRSFSRRSCKQLGYAV